MSNIDYPRADFYNLEEDNYYLYACYLGNGKGVRKVLKFVRYGSRTRMSSSINYEQYSIAIFHDILKDVDEMYSIDSFYDITEDEAKKLLTMLELTS